MCLHRCRDEPRVSSAWLAVFRKRLQYPSLSGPNGKVVASRCSRRGPTGWALPFVGRRYAVGAPRLVHSAAPKLLQTLLALVEHTGQGVRKEELARHATAARRPCACRHFERRNYHVVTIEELTRSLKAASTWSQRRKIEHELVRLDPGVAFHLLYSIATTYGVDTPHDAAASILLQLQPRCPLSCEDALRFLARTDWNLSDHLIPFYLVTQFGQQRVVQAVRLVKTEFDNESQARVTGVGYWAEKPAVLLIEDFVALEHRARKEDAKTRRSE